MDKAIIAAALILVAGSTYAHEGMPADGTMHQLLHAVSGHALMAGGVLIAVLVCGFVVWRRWTAYSTSV